MKPDEIIDRLKNILRDPRMPDLCASAEDVYKDGEALTAAIQAVELLEKIRQELRGDCVACEYYDVLAAIQALTAACQTLTRAIEATNRLEAAKEVDRGNCNLCRYHECGADSWPCNECFHVHQGPVDRWSPM